MDDRSVCLFVKRCFANGICDEDDDEESDYDEENEKSSEFVIAL